ncbi:MAG TPA: tRNA pseudouridine(55) synthase TruB [Patescibacteria group bacterium]|nr:tRNA pseudouridine(55) synthase TruB [Patescibacteria group bacterium]
MKKPLAVYKPKGPSSNQYLNRIRSLLNTKKIGHAGTLDPLASGVLVIGIGREATKQLNTLIKTDKEYIAEIKFGQISTTMDEEGDKEIKCENNPENFNLNTIKNELKKFIGKIKQMPPKYSALKINGQSAYKLARKGKDFDLKERTVTIYDIDILEYKWPYLKLKVHCGSGVYIRSLAHDLGANLSVGAYLSDLERTRVGDFTINDTIDLDKLKIRYDES